MISLLLRPLAAALLLSLAILPAAHADEPSAPVKVDLDLSQPFGTHSLWHFHAAQEPSAYDAFSEADEPGLIHLCLQATPSAPCDPLAAMAPAPDPSYAESWAPHYLNRAELVHAEGGATPLLLVQTASLHSGDGDQVIYTQLLAYDRATDRFKQAYAHVTFRNNNQEDRFIASGPLQGSMISAEPTRDAPFAYWVTVHRPEPTLSYKQVLRYRSATRYADGNPLPVIDAEMPNIELQLGLWHPGQPLPVPASPDYPCPNPRLLHAALWCS